MISTENVDPRCRRALETPLLRFLGASMIESRGQPATLSIPLSDNARNAVGALHGGVIATVLDVAAYLAVVPHLAQQEEAVTIAFAASYVAAPAHDATPRVRGSFLRRSRRLAFLSAELRSGSALLARANVTKSVRS
jgi:uncharacterized protein (TIGR00369 family)